MRAFAIQPNSLGIRGAGRGLTFAVTGNNYDQLADVAESLVARMQENPALGQVRLEYETTLPQLFVEIDRTRASDLGIDISELGDALRAVLVGRSIGSVFVDDNSYDVQLLSTSGSVNDPGDLENVFVQTGDGQMVPLSSFVRLEERAVAPELNREGQNRSVDPPPGLRPNSRSGTHWRRCRRSRAKSWHRKTASCRLPRPPRSSRHPRVC